MKHIITVQHTQSVHHTSFYKVDIHGPAGGVSHMVVGDDGKHRVGHINDMSYVL